MLTQVEGICFPPAKLGALLVGKVVDPAELELTDGDLTFMKRVLTLLTPHCFRPLQAAQVWGVPKSRLSAAVKSRQLSPKLEVIERLKQEYLVEDETQTRLYIRAGRAEPIRSWGLKVYDIGDQKAILTSDWEKFVTRLLIPEGAQFLPFGGQAPTPEDDGPPDFSELLTQLREGRDPKKRLRTRLMEDPGLLVQCYEDILNGTWSHGEELTAGLVRRVHTLYETYRDFQAWNAGQVVDQDGLRRLATIATHRFIWGQPTALMADHPQYPTLLVYVTSLGRSLPGSEKSKPARVRRRGGPPPPPNPEGEPQPAATPTPAEVLATLADARRAQRVMPPPLAADGIARSTIAAGGAFPLPNEGGALAAVPVGERVPPPPNNPPRGPIPGPPVTGRPPGGLPSGPQGRRTTVDNVALVSQEARDMIGSMAPTYPADEVDTLVQLLLNTSRENWADFIQESLEGLDEKT